MGFNLYLTSHQHHLEGPALKPSKPEGIGHGSPFGIELTLWPMADPARDRVSESDQG